MDRSKVDSKQSNSERDSTPKSIAPDDPRLRRRLLSLGVFRIAFAVTPVRFVVATALSFTRPVSSSRVRPRPASREPRPPPAAT